MFSATLSVSAEIYQNYGKSNSIIATENAEVLQEIAEEQIEETLVDATTTDEYQRNGYTLNDIRKMLQQGDATGYMRQYRLEDGPITSEIPKDDVAEIFGEPMSENAIQPFNDFDYNVRLIFGEDRACEDSIVLVLLGDGFTAGNGYGQIGDYQNPAPGTFLRSANEVSQTLTNMYPFNLFSDVFKIYAVETPSTQQGIQVGDVPYAGTYLGTHLRTEWNLNMTRSAHALDISNRVSSNAIMTQVIANTRLGGGVALNIGTGYFNNNSVGISTRFLGGGLSIPGYHSILIHEIGHNFGRLTDEHRTGGTNLGRANVARASDTNEQLKWGHWLGYAGVVRRTENAPSGFIFPSTNNSCKMQGWQETFCAVCRAELVRRMAMISNETFRSGRQPDGAILPATPTIATSAQHNRILPYAFHGNRTLQTIHIPDSVNTIGDFAFIGATGLRTIYNNSIIPQRINNETFAGIERRNITLHILTGRRQAYINAGWTGFAAIIEHSKMPELPQLHTFTWEELRDEINSAPTDNSEFIIHMLNNIQIPNNSDAIIISAGQNIRFQSDGDGVTLIQRNSNQRHFIIKRNAELTLDEGITLSGGIGANNNNSGGVHAQSGGVLNMLDGSRIQNSRYTTGNGGAIQLNDATLNMYGGIITNNHANIGGGIYACEISVVNIENGIFLRNTANNNGGAIFTRNYSDSIQLTDTDYANLYIGEDVIFSGNRATIGFSLPPVNYSETTRIKTRSSSTILHPLNNYDIVYTARMRQGRVSVARNFEELRSAVSLWYDIILLRSNSNIIVPAHTIEIPERRNISLENINPENPIAITQINPAYYHFHMRERATLTLTDGVILCGGRTGRSGGVFAEPHGTLNMREGSVIQNSNGGVGLWSATLNIDGGIIRNNNALQGGGVNAMNNSIVNMSAGKITGNFASHIGGGIYASTPARINITGGYITDNQANRDGGAIFTRTGSNENPVSADAFSNLIVGENAIFSGNVAWNGASFPPSNYADLLNIKSRNASVGTHPLNNFDINYTGNKGNMLMPEVRTFAELRATIENAPARLEITIPIAANISFGNAITVPNNSRITLTHSNPNSDTSEHRILSQTTRQQRHFVVNDDSFFILDDGITLSGGNDNNSNDSGGVIVRGGHLTLNQNSRIINCRRLATGGAILVEGGSLHINGGTISGNTALAGAGVAARGNSWVSMSGGVISNNYATRYSGGAIWAERRVPLTLEYGSISNNRATRWGGGIWTGNYAFNYAYTFISENVNFYDNATAYGASLPPSNLPLGIVGGTSSVWSHILNNYDVAYSFYLHQLPNPNPTVHSWVELRAAVRVAPHDTTIYIADNFRGAPIGVNGAGIQIGRRVKIASATANEQVLTQTNTGFRHFVVNSGTLTLGNDITLSGGNTNSGGVLVRGGGTLTMLNGSVIENVRSIYNSAVQLESRDSWEGRAVFNLDGGQIRNNTSIFGGGVRLVGNARMNMTAGEITDNRATRYSGGGVWIGAITGSVVDGQGLLQTGGTINGNTAHNGNGHQVFAANENSFLNENNSSQSSFTAFGFCPLRGLETNRENLCPSLTHRSVVGKFSFTNIQ